MKKIGLLLLGLSAPVLGNIDVTPGSGKTVRTETVSGLEIQGVQLLGPGGTSSATFTNVGLKVDVTTTSVTGTVTVLPGASNIVVTSTSTLPVKIADVGSTGVPIVSSNTLNIKIADVGATAVPIVTTNTIPTTAIVNAGTTGIPIISSNTLNMKIADVGATGVPIVSSTTLNIKIADVGATGVPIVSSNTLNIKISDVGATAVPTVSTTTQNVYVTNVTSSPLHVQNGAGALVGVGYQLTGASVPVNVLNNVVITNQALASSNTVLPSSLADTSTGTLVMDGNRRIITMNGVSTAMRISTSPAAISNTSTVVLVSSPAAGKFTHICGCSVFNTSATGTYVTLFSSGNITGTGTGGIVRIPAVPSYPPAGFAFNCASPILNTTVGGIQVGVQANASVSSLFIDCQYYQSDTP